MKKINIKYFAKILFSLSFALFLFSCDEELTDDSFASDDVLTVSVASPDVILEERFTENKVTINWTTGSNKDTGASISYLLEIDKAGNNFSMPLEYDMGKNQFLFSFNYKTLNQILLNTFNAVPNTAIELEARVTATFGDGTVAPQTATTTFMVTPYQPVSSQLFIVGSATPIGWDISKAIELSASSTKAGVFIFEGLLSPGNFKFAVSNDGCFCQDFYTQDPLNAMAIVHNIGGSGDDIQWEITNGGKYKIEVNLVELTIKIEKSEDPMFSKIWILGDASASGWNINAPEEFTRSSNPFIFTYEGVFVPGDFK
ncbi:MAG: SusF/SusE family outer membrane protein, partial [Lutibacter sp.]